MSDENQARYNGNPQRSKIPRTTQVKRMHRAAKSGKSLRAWALEYGDLASEWLKAKRK